VEDLDSLPFPDRSVVDLSRYLPSPTFYHRLPHESIIGSRGCPFQCTFCHTDPHTRMRSARNIVDEIEMLHRDHSVVDVAFWDDTFTLSERRATKVCDELLRRNLRIDWCVNARADKVNLALLRHMKRAGCWRVLYGIESGVQKNIDTLKKELTLEQITEAVRMTNRAGIEAYGTFMFGIPGETYQEGLQTIDFACSIGLDFAVFVSLTPFPGSAVYDDVKAGRIRTVKNDPPYDLKNVSFVPEGLTEDQITSLIKQGHKRFYLRPRLVGRRLRKMRNLHDVKKNLKGFFLLLTAS
jgi:anaerobic magnesium-protoporphyrin IX monomethyl ester cyclase